MNNDRLTCSVYLTEKENKMLNELTKKLDHELYGKIGRSKIFCIALKQMYDRMKKDDPEGK